MTSKRVLQEHYNKLLSDYTLAFEGKRRVKAELTDEHLAHTIGIDAGSRARERERNANQDKANLQSELFELRRSYVKLPASAAEKRAYAAYLDEVERGLTHTQKHEKKMHLIGVRVDVAKANTWTRGPHKSSIINLNLGGGWYSYPVGAPLLLNTVSS